MNEDLTGPIDDPASWAPRLGEPEAARALLRAALLAYHTLSYGRRTVNPEEIGTHLDLARVEAELHKALAAVGHPAGAGPG